MSEQAVEKITPEPITPGEVLLEEFMSPLGLSQNRLAQAIKVPPRRVNEIVLGKRRITVNVVAPGPTATDLFTEGKSDELIARITGTIPLGRLGTPDEIAAVVGFLAGPDGTWVNGQVIRTNGGMV